MQKNNVTVNSMKSNMLVVITSCIEGMRQEDAAEMLEISQPRVSNIKNGYQDLFSIDMLISILEKFGYDFSFNYEMTLLDTNCNLNYKNMPDKEETKNAS
jgi:predicted XRE-type DNA-binding protein